MRLSAERLARLLLMRGVSLWPGWILVGLLCFIRGGRECFWQRGEGCC